MTHARPPPTALTDTAELAATARRVAAGAKRPVVLVGLMGAGKSTVGRRLAEILRTDFVDTDDEIIRAAQMSVAEIFERYGEPQFRDGERRVIARLIEEDHGVIATGGGAFINEQTRTLMLERTITVWIDCEIEVLVERTSRRNTRPLLQDGDPAKILAGLYAEREPFYSQAHIRISSNKGPHATTAQAIIEGIDRWL